jgi:nucleoid DNA-binding protein
MIEKYIKELLLTQDKVTVPHLGTFTASFSPSRISADGATLLPPHKDISFSIYIREEDRNDDFMKVVMKAENIGYYDFNESLLAFVEQVQQSIATYGKHHLEGLGTLVKDEYNKIILQQDPNEFLLGDSFGLPTLDTNFINKQKEYETPEIDEVKPIKTEPSEENPNATKTKVIDKDEAISRQEVKQTQEPVEKKPNKQQKTKADATTPERKSDLTWWLAVVPMVFLLAFLIYLFTSPEAMQNFKSYFTSEDKVSEEVNNLINEEETTSSLDSEDNSNLTDEEINPIDNRLSDNPPPIQDTKPVTDPPPVVKDSKTTNDELVSGKFYLVYGSFSAKNGAEKARKMLENQGLEAKLLFLSAKNMYRVVIGEFNSYEEANNKKIALGNDFSQTWVLKGE